LLQGTQQICFGAYRQLKQNKEKRRQQEIGGGGNNVWSSPARQISVSWTRHYCFLQILQSEERVNDQTQLKILKEREREKYLSTLLAHTIHFQSPPPEKKAEAKRNVCIKMNNPS
jgi:hypothetical protein